MTAVKPGANEAGGSAVAAYDALVVGGGAIGLGLALALAEALGPSGRIGVVDPAATGEAARQRNRAGRRPRLGPLGGLQAAA